MQKGQLQDVALIAGIAAVCIVALGYAGLLVLSLLPPASFKEVDLSAWVQAVGSVVAILASAGTVRWAHHMERQRAQEADEQRYQSAAVLFDDLLVRSLHTLNHVDEMTTSGLYEDKGLNCADWIHSLESIQSAANQVQFRDFQTARELRVFLDFRTSLAEMLKNMRKDDGTMPDSAWLAKSPYSRHLRLLRGQQTEVRASPAYQAAYPEGAPPA